MASRDKIRRVCTDAMLLSLALILSYIEAVLPLSAWIPLPGFKIGLSNVVITLTFVLLSPADAAAVSLCRITVMAMLFGNASSFAFALCGGVLSYIGLWLLCRVGRRVFSLIGVSVGCAALHNVGQVSAAAMLYGTQAIIGYLPILLIAALIFGTVTGVLISVIMPRLEKLVKNKSKTF